MPTFHFGILLWRGYVIITILAYYMSGSHRRNFSKKKYIPKGAGTLKTDTSTFGIMVYAVIIIVAALSFFPALAWVR